MYFLYIFIFLLITTSLRLYSVLPVVEGGVLIMNYIEMSKTRYIGCRIIIPNYGSKSNIHGSIYSLETDSRLAKASISGYNIQHN